MGLINAEKLLKTLKQRRDYIRYSAKPMMIKEGT